MRFEKQPMRSTISTRSKRSKSSSSGGTKRASVSKAFWIPSPPNQSNSRGTSSVAVERVDAVAKAPALVHLAARASVGVIRLRHRKPSTPRARSKPRPLRKKIEMVTDQRSLVTHLLEIMFLERIPVVVDNAAGVKTGVIRLDRYFECCTVQGHGI
jgi:hypothetical protein